METFTAQVSDWVQQGKNRLRYVQATATMSVINDAQTPVAKGGRMHVDTGFLRASGQASLTGMPTGPVRNADGHTVLPNDGVVQLVIAKAEPGFPIFFGWTANYALARENKDAFLRLAVQKWQVYVNDAVQKAIQRIANK